MTTREALINLINAVYDYYENPGKYYGRDMLMVLAKPMNDAKNVLCDGDKTDVEHNVRGTLTEIKKLANLALNVNTIGNDNCQQLWDIILECDAKLNDSTSKKDEEHGEDDNEQ